jgi:hypothetical protein
MLCVLQVLVACEAGPKMHQIGSLLMLQTVLAAAQTESSATRSYVGEVKASTSFKCNLAQ